MPHIRAQIRAALKTRVTGLAHTGANVYANRLDSLARDALPAILIETPAEESERRTAGPAGARARAVNFRLHIVAAIDAFASSDDLADFLDEIALSVENAIDADPTLGGLAEIIEIDATGFSPDREGDLDVGVLTISGEARLESRIGAGDVSTALQSGALSVAKVNGTAISRLRSFSLELAAAPINVTDSDSAFAEFIGAAAPSWTAEIEMSLDDGDAAQAALAINTQVSAAFFPRGEFTGAPAKSGTAIVSAVTETTGEDPVRTVRLIGTGSLS